MKILAISASPRKDRMVHNALKEILNGCKSEFKIISLAGKRINGCIGCTACAKDNECKVQDDFNEIENEFKQADIIIFGAPNYFGMVNALAHACLERTFAFRHRGTLSLKGKLGVIVSTCGNRENKDPVSEYIEKMFKYNKIETIGKMQVNQYNQCYTCGFGESCGVGAVVGKHGFLEEILPSHLPNEVKSQAETLKEIENIREILSKNGVEF